MNYPSNAIIVHVQPDFPSYPYLGVAANGNIVLFIGKGRGTCLKGGGHYPVGETRSDWFEEDFKRLSNDIPVVLRNCGG
jgi:hypothetical protein